MLQFSAIEPVTPELLKELMNVPGLQFFSLVGGTALTLKYAHRKSIDLDLFSTEDFNNEDIAAIIQQHFPTFTYQRLSNPIGVFDDAEESEEPVSLKNQTWASVKKSIQKSVQDYLS